MPQHETEAKLHERALMWFVPSLRISCLTATTVPPSHGVTGVALASRKRLGESATDGNTEDGGPLMCQHSKKQVWIVRLQPSGQPTIR